MLKLTVNEMNAGLRIIDSLELWFIFLRERII